MLKCLYKKINKYKIYTHTQHEQVKSNLKLTCIVRLTY